MARWQITGHALQRYRDRIDRSARAGRATRELEALCESAVKVGTRVSRDGRADRYRSADGRVDLVVREGALLTVLTPEMD